MTKKDFERLAVALFHNSTPTWVDGKRQMMIDLRIVLSQLNLYLDSPVKYKLDGDKGTLVFDRVDDFDSMKPKGSA